MPDLLAHVLLAVFACELLRWRLEWLSTDHVTVAMAGALLPDVSKIHLLIPNRLVRRALEVPFDWSGLHTVGGVTVAALIGATLVDRRDRWRVAALLGFGAVTHLVADLFLMTPSGRSYPFAWPVSSYLPPTPGLYLSTGPEPTILSAALVVGLLTIRRWWRGRETEQ
jgi:hypothetical protein